MEPQDAARHFPISKSVEIMNHAYIANIDICTHDKPSSFVRCLKLCCLRYQHVQRLWCFRFSGEGGVSASFVSEASLDTILKH